MKSILYAAAFIFCSTVVAADPLDACKVDRADWYNDHRDALAGDWKVTMGVGVLTMQGMTRQLPAPNEVTNSTISLTDDGLEIGNVPGAGAVALAPWGGEIDYDGNGGGARPEGALSALDMETLIGCDPNILPMLKASGTFSEAEGQVEFDIYLVVQGTDAMYGYTIGRLNGGQGFARRILSFSK